MTIHAIRGMRDLLPEETIWFQRLEAAVREVFALYDFDELRTPVLEPDELFRRAVGEETDVVSKEMYSFADRDGAQLTLRPEATASTVRAYVEHRLWERPGLTRLYYMGPMFRRERPQKGRYRQFYQVGAEVLGGDEPWIDFELLVMLRRLLDRCGIEGAELVLNSVGCPNDRPQYHAALRAALADKLPQMCADCQRRAQTNPLRVLDCKVPEDQPIINALPSIHEFLDPVCRDHFHELRRLLDGSGVAYRIDPRMVRGLDYYTSTAFEFLHGSLGAQNALLGGGRYNGLAQSLGAPANVGGAIGFALGEDRFVLAMQQAFAATQTYPVFQPTPLTALLIPLGAEQLHPALALAERLRGAGLRVAMASPGRKLGKSLELASRIEARHAVIIGSDEVATSRWQVKNISTGAQESLDEPSLLAHLRSREAP
ncbi:MAG: histidine--tRNA ligase [Terriglobales bacterium]